jgi:hypothetical protein
VRALFAGSACAISRGALAGVFLMFLAAGLPGVLNMSGLVLWLINADPFTPLSTRPFENLRNAVSGLHCSRCERTPVLSAPDAGPVFKWTLPLPSPRFLHCSTTEHYLARFS